MMLASVKPVVTTTPNGQIVIPLSSFVTVFFAFFMVEDSVRRSGTSPSIAHRRSMHQVNDCDDVQRNIFYCRLLVRHQVADR